MPSRAQACRSSRVNGTVMRPSRDSLKKRLDYLNHMTEPQLDRFHRAVRKVVHADGQITAEEIQAYSIIEDWKVCQRVESHQ
jgi:hypothetical protein